MPMERVTQHSTQAPAPAQLVLGGSWVWRHAPSPEAFDRVLDAARDEGISWIDTSAAYGECVSLSRRWARRHGAWFSPVVKLRVDTPDTWATATFEAAARQASRDLGVSCAPVLLLHGPPPSLLGRTSSWWPEAVDALTALRDDGLAQRVGVATDLTDSTAILDRRLDVIQVPLNLADPIAVEAFLPRAAQLGIEVMAARALANCVWSQPVSAAGSYTAAYSHQWHRRAAPPVTPEPLEAAVRFVAHAGPRWAVFSTSRPEHVREVAALVRRGPLSRDELQMWLQWARGT